MFASISSPLFQQFESIGLNYAGERNWKYSVIYEYFAFHSDSTDSDCAFMLLSRLKIDSYLAKVSIKLSINGIVAVAAHVTTNYL